MTGFKHPSEHVVLNEEVVRSGPVFVRHTGGSVLEVHDKQKINGEDGHDVERRMGMMRISLSGTPNWHLVWERQKKRKKKESHILKRDAKDFVIFMGGD